MTTRPPHVGLRLLGSAVVALALAAVFALYLRVDFVVGLADQLWACF